MTETLLIALSDLVHKEMSAAHFMQRIVEVIASHFDADRGTLYLLDPSHKELVSVAAQLPELHELRVPLDQGIAGYAARTGRVVNIPYCDADARFWPGVDQQTGYTTRSMLTGPVHDASGGLIGVLQLLNKSDGIFTPQDEATFHTLSPQLASLLAETTFTPSQSGSRVEEADHLPLGGRINRVIGTSNAMRAVFQDIHRVAPTEATVLLRGESGTGKTLVARAIHHNSSRCDGPFVHVDCTTLPESLVENELFGHEKGAYTGAHTDRLGKVAAAEHGTLFLDEIGDLPLPIQSKLLTLLQDLTYIPVGGTQRRRADIRILAATNRPLESLVQNGLFREDLYYRLRVVQLDIPPLRERGREDIIRLIEHFVRTAARRHKRPHCIVREDALDVLLSYSWPGNVRELENCIESAVIFADGVITPSTLSLPRPNATLELRAIDLSAAISTTRAPTPQTPPPSPLPNIFSDEPSLKELERRYIAFLLARHDNNKSACARILGIGRNTLQRKIKEHHLDAS